MLSKADVSGLLSRYPKFEDMCLSLPYAPHMPRGMVKETREVVAIARKFNEEVARPRALELDRKTHEDPDYMPWDLVELANRWGFYTMWIPRMFGGRGYNLPSMSYFSEEVGSVCLGIMNVIGVHYLGVAGVISSANTKLAGRVLREVVRGEKTGSPASSRLPSQSPVRAPTWRRWNLSTRQGHLPCTAGQGGYVVNGTKVFISMGHMSTWTVLCAYEDLKKPSETTVGLMVKTGAKGFSFGTHENKMGQRVCPASVLVFEDCFVPDDQVLFSAELIRKFTKKPVREIAQRYIDYVVGATRPGVCAFGVGAARGAFETALKYASSTTMHGRLLVNHESGCSVCSPRCTRTWHWEGSPTRRPTTPTATGGSTGFSSSSPPITIFASCPRHISTLCSPRCSRRTSPAGSSASSPLTGPGWKTSGAAPAGRPWQRWQARISA